MKATLIITAIIGGFLLACDASQLAGCEYDNSQTCEAIIFKGIL